MEKLYKSLINNRRFLLWEFLWNSPRNNKNVHKIAKNNALYDNSTYARSNF